MLLVAEPDIMSPASESAAAPESTATLLFTDVEGSTQRWERHTAAMASALREHDGLLHEAIAAHRGRVFKTIGDAFCAIFSRPPDALAAALEAQRELATRDWSSVEGLHVRMAIHAGTVESRDDDYFGATLNRIARLVSIGHGNQILLSASAAALIGSSLPDGVALIGLGEHRLKDLTQPETVFQVSVGDLQALFPPLRSLSVLPNNLPLQLTTFVGRTDVLEEARALLKTTRALTLVGPGGIGKTRVSLELGSDALTHFPQGVYFVEFAAIAQAHDVVATIAAALDLGSPSSATMERTLLEYLTSRRVLLIFDNCEHLVDEIARATAKILGTCAEVTILATSREALRVSGEHVFRMPSLGLPPEGENVDFATIEASEAVALFVSRARAADRKFALTEANAPILADICRRLDGIALAIELAAARVTMLSPKDLRARIASRLVILTGGSRTALPRQRTVRALIDWSYDLLDADERRLLARLGVFADAFSFEAAAGVGKGENGDEFDVLDVLSRLVDKSLVAVDVDERGAIVRYHLLETIREYAIEKLSQSGDSADTMLAYVLSYRDLVERSFATWGTTSSKEWEALVAHEIANLRAALTWLFGEGADRQAGIAMVARARRLYARIAPAEGARWIEAAGGAVDASTPLGIRAELALAHAQMLMALHRAADALAAAERAADAFAAVHDELGLAEARGFMGLALTMLGSNERGEALLSESIATYERAGARALSSYALSDLALSRYFSNDTAGAIALFDRAREAFAELGNESAAVITISNLSEVRFDVGDATEALALIVSAIASEAPRLHLGMFYANKAMYLTALARYDEAREAVRMSLRHARGVQAEVEIAIALKHAVAIATFRDGPVANAGDALRAARVFAVAERRLRELGATPSPGDQREADRARAALARAVGDATFATIEAETGGWAIERAIAEASAL
jgi:predicted ATPase/class 3 adenylate cyclase